MAFSMSMHLVVPSPFDFITDLIMMGRTRFFPCDPDALFVKWEQKVLYKTKYVIDFLCPLETRLKSKPIAGGLLAPRERASGQLLRLVRSFDSASNMDILHLFLTYGIHYVTKRVFGSVGLAS